MSNFPIEAAGETVVLELTKKPDPMLKPGDAIDTSGRVIVDSCRKKPGVNVWVVKGHFIVGLKEL